MLSSSNNTANQNQTVPTTNANSVTVAVSAPQFELAGFDETLEELQKCLGMPKCSASNVATTLSITSTATVAAVESWYDALAETGQVTLAIAGLNLFVANGSKLKEFYDRHTKLQTLQQLFIKALPMGRIDSCEYGKGAKKAILQKPFAADKIIDFLYRNGHATLTLNNGAITFTLKNNGFFSFRLGMAAVSSFAASIITTGVFVSYELANRDAPDAQQKQEEVPMRVAAMLSSAIPFTSIMSKLMDCCYKQELSLFLALKNVVMELYESTHNLHNMPYEFINLLKAFISPEYMDQNLDIIERCRRYFDNLEHNAIKTKVSALESEVSTLKSTVTTLETGLDSLQRADSVFEGQFTTLEEANKDASALLEKLNEQYDKESKQLAELTIESKRHSQLLDEYNETNSLLSELNVSTDGGLKPHYPYRPQ